MKGLPMTRFRKPDLGLREISEWPKNVLINDWSTTGKVMQEPLEGTQINQ